MGTGAHWINLFGLHPILVIPHTPHTVIVSNLKSDIGNLLGKKENELEEMIYITECIFANKIVSVDLASI